MIRMSDTDDPSLDPDRERQRRFLAEAFGLSDDEIESLLDALVRFREDTEDYLKKDNFEGKMSQRSENDGLEHLARIGQNTSTPIDIYEVNGKQLVPHEQFNEIIEDHNQTLDLIIDMLSKIEEGVGRANSESSERYYSEETWQAVEDLKKD